MAEPPVRSGRVQKRPHESRSDVKPKPEVPTTSATATLKSKLSTTTTPPGSTPNVVENRIQKKYHDLPEEYKEVDADTEGGKFKSLIEDSKTSDLNPRPGEALRFTYLKPSESDPAKAQWKLRVDVPANSRLHFPKFYFEVQGKRLDRLSPQMKKELAFKMLEKPPPGRDALGKFTTNHPLRKLYAKLPFGAIVFYRLQKDRGGFADGKDHNVKVWIDGEVMEYHSKSMQKALNKAAQDDTAGFRDFLKKDPSEWNKSFEDPRKEKEWEKDIEILKLVLDTLGGCQIQYKQDESSKLYELRIFHPKDGLVLNNLSNERHKRSDICRALHAFNKDLLANWYDLRVKYGTEGEEYNIQTITNELQKLDVDWIEVVDVTLNSGSFFNLRKTLDRNRPGSKIFYKFTNGRYVTVRVQKEGRMIAEGQANNVKQAIALIMEDTQFHEVLQYEQYESTYKDLIIKLAEHNIKNPCVLHKTTKLLRERVFNWLREPSTHVVKVQHDDGEIYGFGKTEEEAIKQTEEQLDFTLMSREKLLSEFDEVPAKRKQALEGLYDDLQLQLKNVHACELYLKALDQGVSVRAMSPYIGLAGEAQGKNIESALKKLRNIIKGNERFQRFANNPRPTYGHKTITLQEPEWRPLTDEDDGGPIRIDRRPGLDLAEGYQAEIMERKDTTFAIRIKGMQNGVTDRLLLVEEVKLRSAFDHVQYLLQFQRASEEDPRFHSLYRSLPPAKEGRRAEILYREKMSGNVRNKDACIVRLEDRFNKDCPVFERHSNTLPGAIRAMEEHLSYEKAMNPTVEATNRKERLEKMRSDFKEIIWVVMIHYGRSHIFIRGKDGESIDMKVEHPLYGLQAHASGRTKAKVMEDLLRKLKIKLPELRGTHVFWDGPYHLDAKSYGVQFDGSIAEDHGGVPEYTPVTDIFQRDGLFAPIMDKCRKIGLQKGQYRISFRAKGLHAGVLLEQTNGLKDKLPNGRLERTLNSNLQDSVTGILYDLNFEKVDKKDKLFKPLFDAFQRKGMLNVHISTQKISLGDYQAKIIHQKQIRYPTIDEDGKLGIETVMAQEGIRRASALAKGDRERILATRVLCGIYLEDDFRIYLPLDKKKIHATELSVANLVDHLEYTELKKKDKQYEKALEGMGKDVWNTRTEEPWKKLVKDKLSSVGSSRLFIRKLVGGGGGITYRVKVTHNNFGLIAYKENHNVLSLIADVVKDIEEQAGKAYMGWEKTWNLMTKLEVDKEEEE